MLIKGMEGGEKNWSSGGAMDKWAAPARLYLAACAFTISNSRRARDARALWLLRLGRYCQSVARAEMAN